MTQLEQFKRDGFLVLEGFVDGSACDDLADRARELAETLAPGVDPTVFSTRDQRHSQDEYFLGSGGAMRPFFEEDAFDESGALTVPISRAVNKIGHALHDLDPVFDRFSRTRELAELTSGLGIQSALLLQSMVIFKQPGIGGVVTWHQDRTFLYTEPANVLGYWFALEDATLENGCLFALPGGHRAGLKARFARAHGGGTEMRVLDDSPWPEEKFVPLEVPKGSLIVLDGELPHGSHANRSNQSRLAYTLHVIDSSAKYPADNWLQRSEPLRGFGAS